VSFNHESSGLSGVHPLAVPAQLNAEPVYPGLNFTLLNQFFCFRLSGALRIRASIVNLLLIIALHIYPAYSAFNWGPFSKKII